MGQGLSCASTGRRAGTAPDFNRYVEEIAAAVPLTNVPFDRLAPAVV